MTLISTPASNSGELSVNDSHTPATTKIANHPHMEAPLRAIAEEHCVSFEELSIFPVGLAVKKHIAGGKVKSITQPLQVFVDRKYAFFESRPKPQDESPKNFTNIHMVAVAGTTEPFSEKETRALSATQASNWPTLVDAWEAELTQGQ